MINKVMSSISVNHLSREIISIKLNIRVIGLGRVALALTGRKWILLIFKEGHMLV